MAIEVEKKYRLTKDQRRAVEKRLRGLGIKPRPVEFEENTIYRGGNLQPGNRALRLRRVNGRAILTFKRRFPSKSSIKRQQEDETLLGNPDALNTILKALGFEPALVYEKRRTCWLVGKVQLLIDELPYGLFMEIEASEKDIRRVEKKIGALEFEAVDETYPTLTAKFGKKRRGIIEARFK
jgi:adenylate cyclase class 2